MPLSLARPGQQPGPARRAPRPQKRARLRSRVRRALIVAGLHAAPRLRARRDRVYIAHRRPSARSCRPAGSPLARACQGSGGAAAGGSTARRAHSRPHLRDSGASEMCALKLATTPSLPAEAARGRVAALCAPMPCRPTGLLTRSAWRAARPDGWRAPLERHAQRKLHNAPVRCARAGVRRRRDDLERLALPAHHVKALGRQHP